MKKSILLTIAVALVLFVVLVTVPTDKSTSDISATAAESVAPPAPTITEATEVADVDLAAGTPITQRTIRYLPRDHGLSPDVAERLKTFAALMHDEVIHKMTEVAVIEVISPNEREVRVMLAPETVSELQRQFLEGCVTILGDELDAGLVAMLDSSLLYLGKHPLEWTFVAVDGDFSNAQQIQWARTTHYPEGHEIKNSMAGGFYHREGFLADYTELARYVLGS